VFLPWASK